MYFQELYYLVYEHFNCIYILLNKNLPSYVMARKLT